MESESKREVVSSVIDRFQWCRCAIGLHKRTIIDRFEVVNSHDSVLGVNIVSQCINCGKIKTNFISTSSER